MICPVWSRGNPPLDGSRVFRITSVKRPLNGPYLEAEAFEEFATVQAGIPPVVTFQNQPTTSGGTGGISLPITTRFPLELPWDMAVGRTMQITDLCARAQQIYTAFQLYGGTLPDIFDVFTSHGLVCVGGVLGNYPSATLAIDDVVGFTITPHSDSRGVVDATAADLLNYWVTASVTRPELFSRARYAVLANPTTGAHEIIAWQTITQIGSAYQVTGIIRGLFDTEPQDFAGANSVFLFSTLPFTVDRRGDWANGVTLNLKAVPYNDSDAGTPTAAATQTLTLTERAARAFPVTNPRANGLGPILNPSYQAGAPIQITWLPRTRGAGCGYNNPQGIFDPNIATEGDFLVRIVVAGIVTRTITIAPTATVNLGDGVPRLVCNYDASLDGNPASFTAKISARVNGWESLQSTNITVVKQ